MKMSQLFSQTLRAVPSEVEADSHALLLRAGFIRQLASGIFHYLPLGLRMKQKIEQIMREEINAIGGQEVSMPVIQPAELWQETGRWGTIGSELGRFKDKNGRDMVLAMTHEEAVGDLVRNEIRSYRQLPQLIYHIQTKWRDDPRPRAGLIRVREFTMLDSYSLDVDWAGLEKQYQAHEAAYARIFQRCGIPVLSVAADTGMMGGKVSHEYMYLSDIGEDTLVICPECGNAANRQVACFNKGATSDEDELPCEKIATPNVKTIAELADFLSIPTQKTAKAVFFIAEMPSREDTPLVFAVIRGDLEVNETKLSRAIGAISLRPALDAEIRNCGGMPGYASPVGIKPQSNLIIVVDDSIVISKNLVAGANKEGFHLLNVNFGRDFTAGQVLDIATAQPGFACQICGHPLECSRGVEVGNIFQLGTWYSDALGCNFTDENGHLKPVVMGSYGIGVGRLMACIAEEYHDECGLCLPASVAPYTVYMVVIPGKQVDVISKAIEVYGLLQAAGIEVLLDDRPDSAGIKFNDADLIGLPIRITISERTIQNGGVEYKLRNSAEKSFLSFEEIHEQIIRDISR